MIEKTKLGLWDFFVSMLSGYAFVLNVLVHCIIKGTVTLNMIFESSAALLAVGGLLTIILIGLLFEPIANIVLKLLTNYPWNYPEKFGFKEWDSNIEILRVKARTNVPTEITDVYHYCKNCVQQKGLADLYMPFLAKYGFYRNITVMLLLNLISVLLFYELSFLKMCMVLLAILIMIIVYSYRCKVFSRHLTSTVYTQFVLLFEKSSKEG